MSRASRVRWFRVRVHPVQVPSSSIAVLLKHAGVGASVMHCLPAYPGR